ncbi:MAG: hypothetical protein LBJ00_11665 [Planctomycetaceae bacterium]|nr:hypothetical protein [Planctomycetaceae bacterium]
MKRLFRGEAYRPAGYGIIQHADNADFKVCVVCVLIFLRISINLSEWFFLRSYWFFLYLVFVN